MLLMTAQAQFLLFWRVFHSKLCSGCSVASCNNVYCNEIESVTLIFGSLPVCRRPTACYYNGVCLDYCNTLYPVRWCIIFFATVWNVVNDTSLLLMLQFSVANCQATLSGIKKYIVTVEQVPHFIRV